MSGTIELRSGMRWSASGWLFDWVVRFMASRVGDAIVAQGLRAIIDEHLGWASLVDLPPESRVKLVGLLDEELVRAAHAELPDTVPERAAVIAHVSSLSDLARGLLARSVGDVEDELRRLRERPDAPTLDIEWLLLRCGDTVDAAGEVNLISYVQLVNDVEAFRAEFPNLLSPLARL